MQKQEISNKSLSSLNPSNGAINIDVKYDEDIYTNNGISVVLQKPNIASVELMGQPLIKDNVSSIDGELMIQQDGSTIIHIDENGDLYISDENSALYDINANGELIFNQTL